MLEMIVVFDSHTHNLLRGGHRWWAPYTHLYGLSTMAVIQEKLKVKDPDTNTTNNISSTCARQTFRESGARRGKAQIRWRSRVTRSEDFPQKRRRQWECSGSEHIGVDSDVIRAGWNLPLQFTPGAFAV